jgi:hypothetical protein
MKDDRIILVDGNENEFQSFLHTFGSEMAEQYTLILDAMEDREDVRLDFDNYCRFKYNFFIEKSNG